MSPSWVWHQGRQEPFKEGDLFGVVALLEYFVEQQTVSDALGGVIASWKQACEGSGYGTIVFDFAAIEADPHLHKTLAWALRDVEGEVERRWAGVIPPDVLSRYDPEIVSFDPFPTRRMIDVIRRLRRVVGEVDDGAGPSITGATRGTAS